MIEAFLQQDCIKPPLTTDVHVCFLMTPNVLILHGWELIIEDDKSPHGSRI